jgi:hypothetical protein
MLLCFSYIVGFECRDKWRDLRRKNVTYLRNTQRELKEKAQAMDKIVGFSRERRHPTPRVSRTYLQVPEISQTSSRHVLLGPAHF